MTDYRQFVQRIGEADDGEQELVFPELYSDFDDNVIIENTDEDMELGFNNRHLIGGRVATLTPFLAPRENNTGLGIVICPGGGYFLLADDMEGRDVARFFNSFGVNAFVLDYRMPKDEDGEQRKYGPLRDAQRAIRLVRSRSKEYGLKADRIGIMGFSAGGHVAACASTMFKDEDEKDAKLATYSCRPDFSVLIYPVISMQDGVTHDSSRELLLGKDASQADKDDFSAEMRVTSETPPAILVQANDDAVRVENSLLYYKALREADVPVSMHIFATGGHGYGMNAGQGAVHGWPEDVRNWLLNLK